MNLEKANDWIADAVVGGIALLALSVLTAVGVVFLLLMAYPPFWVSFVLFILLSWALGRKIDYYENYQEEE